MPGDLARAEPEGAPVGFAGIDDATSCVRTQIGSETALKICSHSPLLSLVAPHELA